MPINKRFCLCSLALVLAASSCLAQVSGGLPPSPLHIDASLSTEPGPSSFHAGSSTAPDGQTLGLNSRYLLRNGKPWLPVMGEFHFTRVPEAEWEEEILKMKASGVSIIATYVIWIHHEEVEGEFDWSGRRDLRRFVALCGKHGMYVYLRIGPWAHGEARNGGFPDWLLQKAPHNRENDPTYLSFVRKYYDQTAAQVKGELWKDGGPVMGVQLENEYGRRGPDAGEAHILELKRLAIQAGLDVPFYSVTGWDGAAVPHGEVIAVFGGYPDAPWDGSLHNLPPQEVYTFRFHSRVSGNMGAIGVAAKAQPEQTYDFPFVTAEMGGGIQDTYHRRPVLQPDDVAAMVPVMLGSGVNLYGSYMFQGGENPDGKRTTLQESQRTGYPTDVPVKSYDFQAPLGEFGEEREVLRKLKTFQYFLQSFGPELAPMEAHAPAALPNGPSDLSVPRVAVRAHGESGFLFFNNYVRNATMPARAGFQVAVKLPSSTVLLPQKPLTLPSGTYGFWPINMRIGGARLRYATAQPFTTLHLGSSTVYYFVATKGVSPEFVWDQGAGLHLLGNVGELANENGVTVVRKLVPSLAPAMRVDGEGNPTEIVLLSERQAEDAWLAPASSGDWLLITAAEYYNDGRRVFLNRLNDPAFTFSLMPALKAGMKTAVPLRRMETAGSSEYAVTLPEQHPALTMTQTAQAGTLPAVASGPAVSWRGGVAMAPDDPAFHQAATWSLKFSPGAWDGVKDLFLKVDYNGDVARLVADGKLLDDNFYNGQPWLIGLRRFRSSLAEHGGELEILPRRGDAPIFLEDKVRDASTGQVLRLNHATLLPEYELTFELP